jgi:hypothetical protein
LTNLKPRLGVPARRKVDSNVEGASVP